MTKTHAAVPPSTAPPSAVSTTAVSIGVAGSLGPERIARIARSVQNAGFHALWVNDTPDGDAIAALGAAARATDGLALATGVVPLDRRPPADVLRALTLAGVPDERLTLGVGSGAARTRQLALVRDGVARLREGRSARIVVGALGPRMRRLGARDADGVLLTWLTPGAAVEQRDDAHTENPAARACLYVRTALDHAGRERMLREADRYAGYPNYAANFARLGFDAGDAVLPPPGGEPDPAGVTPTLSAYLAAADEVVLRAVVDDDPAAYERFVADAATAVETARRAAS
ncbi:LLM class flavin-dependent oxidoreductase [Microbacterium sp. 18062]|uniref:LLM class flavin-dependent oxidoreductase n=1 Tax=Microbacterium sp. 18062 TaxID=2681410 RepID=UPI001359DCD8|nr:LLM class flavin-dependent oxidoreductase [Microbacterium sp. 18062]